MKDIISHYLTKVKTPVFYFSNMIYLRTTQDIKKKEQMFRVEHSSFLKLFLIVFKKHNPKGINCYSWKISPFLYYK